MILKTLEDHIEEFCPSCNCKHDSNWRAEFEHFMCYKRLDCSSCGYVLFKKLDFSSDGSILG